MTTKLFVVIRKDLPSAAQKAVQACHALAEFLLKHTDVAETWRPSGYLVLLETTSEECLQHLVTKADSMGIKASLFEEPDLGGSVTAIAMESKGKKLLGKLPLAFSS